MSEEMTVRLSGNNTLAPSSGEKSIQFSMLYGDKYMSVSAESVKEVQTTPDGDIKLVGNNGNYVVTVADNDKSDNNYNTFTTAGEGSGDIEFNLKKDGLEISGNTTATVTSEGNAQEKEQTINNPEKEKIASGSGTSAKNTFSDVTDTTHPYYNAIYWASGKGITTGFSDGTFKPYDNCTRGQVVTFLWRLAGKPEPSASTKVEFSDMVASSHPYYKAILWAVEKGITTGFNEGTFKPFDNCSRGQIVTFIYRYAGSPSISGKTANFKDMVSSSHPFYNPIVWASTNGITTGFSDNTFGPAQKCTRGQVVTFLYRYSNK